MAFSLGVWAQGTASGGTVYRWEADQGESGTGFVLFDSGLRTIRPSDGRGVPLGSLVVDAAAGHATGDAEGVDRSLVLKVAAAILKAYSRSGDVPETAHAYYG
jgi:hypothetical protein